MLYWWNVIKGVLADMHHIHSQGVLRAAMGKHSLLLKPTRSYVTVPLWSWAKADSEILGGLVSSGLLWGLLQPTWLWPLQNKDRTAESADLAHLQCVVLLFFQARQLFTGNWSKNTLLSVPTSCWAVVKGKLTSIKAPDCIWIRSGFGSHYLFSVTADARSWSHS